MKIHFLGDSIKMNSGYSIVIRNLAIGLKRLGHNVSTTGLQTAYVPEYFDDGNGEKIEVMPIQSDKADDIGQFMNNIQNIGPDIVIYVGNFGDMDTEVPSLAKVYPGSYVYVPINGRDVPLGIVNDLNKIVSKGGKVIAMCKCGYEEMKRAGVNVDRYIYHGYDENIFKKTDIRSIKGGEIVSILKWNKENNRWIQDDIVISEVGNLLEYGKKFIYLHVGQNIGVRKRQERLLTAYSIMIKESKQLKDRTHLHMHCLPISGRGLNLIEVIMKLGIHENVSFSYGSYLSAGWNPESLNILYNLADVHISASSSEGFGIPTTESIACGSPNIAPNCTSFTELIGDGEKDPSESRGYLAIVESWQMEPIGRFKPLVDQEHLAVLMKKIYVDHERRKLFAKNGVEWVKQYTWEKIVNEWDLLLKGMKGE